MAESDDRLTRSYRDLAREEPPPALDAAILAAARESVRPRARNRWTGPVSIAAVLVLGLGIALRMQTEQPGIETSAPSSASSAEYPSAPSVDTAAPDAAVEETRPQAKDATAPALRARVQAVPLVESEKNVAATPAPALEALAKQRSDVPATEVARAEARPFAEAPAAAAASPAPMRAKREVAAGAVAQDSAVKPDADERVTELERIARLRRDGKDTEADKALEEFRRRNPGYRIPEAMWERVRPR